ncbi:MAG TPA: SGNH hydrolase domain-containing protein, partial [Dongiaceae bacterium]
AAGRLGVFAGNMGCAPLIGVREPRRPDCRAISEASLRLIVETPSVRTVVLAARWGWWAEGLPYKREAGAPVKLVLGEASSGATDNHAALAAGLEQTVAVLIAAGKRVWLVGPVPEVGYDVPRYFHLRALGLADGMNIAPSLSDFGARQAFVLGLFGDLARRYPIGTVWPHQGLCGDAGCDIVRDGHLLYADDDHLSVFGARSLAALFAPVFEQGLGATLPAATAGVAPPAGPATSR